MWDTYGSRLEPAVEGRRYRRARRRRLDPLEVLLDHGATHFVYGVVNFAKGRKRGGPRADGVAGSYGRLTSGAKRRGPCDLDPYEIRASGTVPGAL